MSSENGSKLEIMSVAMTSAAKIPGKAMAFVYNQRVGGYIPWFFKFFRMSVNVGW